MLCGADAEKKKEMVGGEEDEGEEGGWVSQCRATESVGGSEDGVVGHSISHQDFTVAVSFFFTLDNEILPWIELSKIQVKR